MLDLSRARPLIDACDDPALRAAVANLDRARHDLAAYKVRPIGERRREAEAALRAEALEAAKASRPITLDASTLTAADDADVAERIAYDAFERNVQMRTAELEGYCSTVEASVSMLCAIAAERARLVATAHEDDVDPYTDLTRVYSAPLRLPDIAYVPGQVTESFGRYRLVQWWPLDVRPAALLFPVADPLMMERSAWTEWAWTQLALPKREGFRIEADSGLLRFVQRWRPQRMHFAHHGDVVRPRRKHVHTGDSGDTYEDGQGVWIGTGPNGEQGVTVEDLPRSLEPVTFSVPAAPPITFR